jgi:hypothetical protein
MARQMVGSRPTRTRGSRGTIIRLTVALGLCLSLALFAPSARARPAVPSRAAGSQTGPAQDIVDLLVRAGRAFSARRFDVAVRLYRLASTLDPNDGQPLVMAGVAAYQSNAPSAAQHDLRRALRRQLAPEDRELAMTYLGLIADDRAASDSQSATAPRDPRAAWAASLSSTVSGGYDSNARQARRGVLEIDSLATATGDGSVFTSAAVEAGLQFSIDPRTELDLTLGVEQSVYPNRNLAELDTQDHTWMLALAHRLRPDLHLRLLATTDLSFTGVGTELQPFQSSFRLEPQVMFGSGRARLRLTAAWQTTNTQDPTLSYLSGRRLEGAVTPTLSISGWTGSLGARLRHNALGTERSASEVVDDPLCPTCTRTTVASHLHRSLAAIFVVSGPYRWRIRPTVWGRWEIRIYERAQFTETRAGSGVQESEAHLRRDEQLAVGSGLAVRLDGRFTVNVRYENNGFSSNLTPLSPPPPCSAAPCPAPTTPRRRGFRKHALTLDLTTEWQ